MPEGSWHVYLLACDDDTLYCGVTNDLARRIEEHNAGTGARYTRSRRPVRLVAAAPCPGRGAAQRAEAAIKRLPRNRKVAHLFSLPGAASAERLGFSAPQEYTETTPATTPASDDMHCTEHDIDSYRGKISKDEINALPLRAWDGDIVIVADEQTARQAVEEIAGENVLGFDTESRPAFKKGRYYLPSLIQVGTADKVYIFLLSKTPFPDGLKRIFEDPAVLKSGVAVRDDVRDLQKIAHFEPAGFVDLGVTALELKLDTHGLRNLAAKFLGFRISKGARCTNWASKTLSRAQINYAATDAWVSRELYLAMRAEGLIDPVRDHGNGNKHPNGNGNGKR